MAGGVPHLWKLTCRSFLVFHDIPELGATPVLVRALELTHDENLQLTRLVSAAVRGYVRNPDGASYTSDVTPAAVFEYSIPTLDFTVKTLDTGALSDVSTEALSGRAQWVDLDGEGLPGLLLQQDGALYFKRNRGGGRFTAAQRLDTQPSLSALGDGVLQVQDVGATGERAMVALARPLSGYFLRTEEGEWARRSN